MSLVYSFLRQGSGSWREEESNGTDSSGYTSVAALAVAMTTSDADSEDDRFAGSAQRQSITASYGKNSVENSSSSSDSDSSGSSDDDDDDDSSSTDSSDDDVCGSSRSESAVTGPNGEMASMFGSHTHAPHTAPERQRLSHSDEAPQGTSLLQLSGAHPSQYGSTLLGASCASIDELPPPPRDSDALLSRRPSVKRNASSNQKPHKTDPLQSSLMMNAEDDDISQPSVAPRDGASTRSGSPLPAVFTPTRLPSAPSRRPSGHSGAPSHSGPPNFPERQLSGSYRNPSGRGDLYGRLSSLKTARVLLHGGNPSRKAVPNMQNFTNNEAALWATMQQSRKGSAAAPTPDTTPASLSTNGTGSSTRRARTAPSAADHSQPMPVNAQHSVQVFRGDFDNDISLDSVKMAAAQARERAAGGVGPDGMPSFVTNELTHSLLDNSVNAGAPAFRLLTFQKQDDGPLPPRAEHKVKRKEKKDKKDKKHKKKDKQSKKKPSGEGKKSNDDLANGDLVAPESPATCAPNPAPPPTIPQHPSQCRQATIAVSSPAPNAAAPVPAPAPAPAAAIAPSSLRQASSAGTVEELNARNAASRRREAQEALRRNSITRPTTVTQQPPPLPTPQNTVVRPRSATETQDRRPDFVGPHKDSDRIKVYTQPPTVSPSATVRRTTVRPKPQNESMATTRSVASNGAKPSSLPPLRKR